MIQLGRALTDPDLRPPVMALYVYNSNPAAVCPNSSLVLEGLAREDLFTVVHEQVQTDTADYADLVLPATTSMEHLDVYRSFGHLYLQLAEPVISPLGEARSNWEVFGQLARRHGRSRDGALRHAAPGAGRRVPPRRRAGGRRRDPCAAAGRALGAARGAAAVPAVRRRRAHALGTRGVLLGHAPRAGAAAAAHLRSAPGEPGQPGRRDALPAALPRPAEPLLPELVVQPVHAPAGAPGRSRPSSSTPTTRRPRQIDGALVALANDRGRALFTAVLSDDTPPGQVVVEGIWWHKFMPGGRGVNVLTSDGLADMGGGPAFHSTMVEVARADPSEATFSGHAQHAAGGSPDDPRAPRSPRLIFDRSNSRVTS